MRFLKSRSLHGKFISILLMISGVLALLGAGLGYELSYRHAYAQGDATLRGLVTAIEKSAAVGTYANDPVLLQELVEGIGQNPLVAQATVSDLRGKVLAQAKKNADDVAAQAGGLIIKRTLLSPFDQTELVGSLVVRANEQRLFSEARRLAAILGASLVSLTLILALILNHLALRLLSRPLKQLAVDLRSREPGSGQSVCISGDHLDDELGIVAAAANRFLMASNDALQRERAMRDEIAALEAQFRQIFDSSSAGIFVLDKEHRLINCNPTVTRLLGAVQGDVASWHAQDFLDIAFSDSERIRDMAAKALQSEETQSTDLQLQRLDGGKMWVHCLLTSRHSPELIIEGVIYDVTQRKQSEHDATHRATHDPLTGLSNRMGLEVALDGFVARGCTTGNNVAVLFIDLDGFKKVNDQFGHAAGDQVLTECARRLRKLVRRGSDLLGRLGGDELIVILGDVSSDHHMVASLARNIILSLSEPFDLRDGRTARIGASVGIASFPDHAHGRDELLMAADAAMYRAKRSGKGAFFISGKVTPEKVAVPRAKSLANELAQ